MRLAPAVVLGTMLLGSTGALAQHVVTEAEAGKLTLEALTAAPPPPRPIYRAYVRRAMAVRHVHGHTVIIHHEPHRHYRHRR